MKENKRTKGDNWYWVYWTKSDSENDENDENAIDFRGRMYKEKSGTTTKVNLVEGFQKENDMENFFSKKITEE